MRSKTTKKLVMLHGFPLSGKSTAAEKIKSMLENQGLPAELLSTAGARLRSRPHGSTGRFVDEGNTVTRRAKDKAYQALLNRAVRAVKLGKVPILDGTYHRFYRRAAVYELAKNEGLDFYVVWMVFDDRKGIERMLAERSKKPFTGSLHTWQQYITMVKQTDRLEDYELRSKKDVRVIRFDRRRGSVKLYNCGRRDFFAGHLINAVKIHAKTDRVSRQHIF